MQTYKNNKLESFKRLGAVRFVLVYGLLIFGIGASILLFILDRVWDYGLDFSMYFESGWGRDLFGFFVQGMLTGLIWAILMWFLFVKREAKSKKRDS